MFCLYSPGGGGRMAKRMTDTKKLRKKWLRTLPDKYKVFWVFILDECDHAGIAEWDIELFSMMINPDTPLIESEIKEIFKDKFHFFDNDEKIFIPDFISFQYGELTPKNRVHKSVIDILKKHNLLDFKPLISPLKGFKDKDKDKDKDTDKETDKDTEKIDLPDHLNTPEFHTTWDDWIKDRKARRKTPTVKAIELTIKKLSKYDVNIAIQMLLKSIENSWTGVFPLDNKKTSRADQQTENIKKLYDTAQE